MSIFYGNCRIAAEYDKETRNLSVKVDGLTGDLTLLLAAIVNQISSTAHISGAELACRIGSASDDTRSLTDGAGTIDLSAIQRAKDKLNGN